MKISLAALDDGVGVDPGAGPELDPDPEVTPELSDPAGDRFGVDLFKCYQTFFSLSLSLQRNKLECFVSDNFFPR